MLRFFDLANAITLIALLSAAGCTLLAMNGLFAAAAVALIIAGLCDLFDGFVARRLNRTEEQQRFGGRLDSLVDACSFGLAPAVLLYTAGLKQPFDLPLLGIFLICAIWRLAYFDTVGLEIEGPVRYFIGLPTTYVALVLPLVFLTALISTNAFLITMRIAVIVLAAALVSSFRVRKPGGLAYVFFLLLAIAVASILIGSAPLLHSRLQM
jgi:CDP-diacylglycerol--serine O-phosphatidyltransferase